MSSKDFDQALETCLQIATASDRCEEELDLFWDSLARHPHWTKSDMLALQRKALCALSRRIRESQ
jgi:hypothetical protein